MLYVRNSHNLYLHLRLLIINASTTTVTLRFNMTSSFRGSPRTPLSYHRAGSIPRTPSLTQGKQTETIKQIECEVLTLVSLL